MYECLWLVFAAVLSFGLVLKGCWGSAGVGSGRGDRLLLYYCRFGSMSGLGERDLLPVIRELDSYEFEQFVAALWKLRGWATETTGQSGDRGIDVVAESGFPLEIEMHIQAKRYGGDSQVSGPEMQKYGSLTRRSGVDIVAVVTSGSFTSQAVSLAEEFNIKLVNGVSLVKLVRELDAGELLDEYREETDVRRVDVEQYSSSGESSGFEFNTSESTEGLKPSSAVSSGDWLRLELVGAERKQGYLESIPERKRKRVDPIDGLVLAFEITNLSDENWEFISQNINGGGGAVIGYDTDGFSYEATYSLEYMKPPRNEAPGNWNWATATIRGDSRARVVTWLDIGSATDIVSVEYEEKIWRGIDREYADHKDVESVQMSFSKSVERVVPELPTPVAESIE